MLYLVREGPSFGLRQLTEIRNEYGFEKGESYGLAVGYYWPTGLHVLAYYDFFAKTENEVRRYPVGVLVDPCSTNRLGG